MNWKLTNDKQEQAEADYASGGPRFDRVRSYAGEDAGFGVYLTVCDRLCQNRTGVSIFDLADYAWRDAYEAAQPPQEAVQAAIAADDTFGYLARVSDG